MFIVSTVDLFDIDNIIIYNKCNGVTTLYFTISLIYLIILASWTINLFRFYKVSSNLRLHTLMTYFICLKVSYLCIHLNEQNNRLLFLYYFCCYYYYKLVHMLNSNSHFINKEFHKC